MGMIAENISFRYAAAPVLDDVSLHIPDGSFVVLLGKNGSGKSTLLRILSGMLPCQKGTVRIDGKDLKTFTPRQRSRVIGFLPQHFRMAFSFSVQDVVMTGRAAHIALRPGKKDVELVRQAMERTGIDHLRKRPFTEISGGEQQLARIARVLSQQPGRILLDEPTTHLDLYNQARVLNLLKELASSGITVAAVLHDPSAAFVYGDDFVYLQNGRRLKLQEQQEPWDEDVLRQVYGLALECVPYRGRALVAPVLNDSGDLENGRRAKSPEIGRGQ